MPAISPANYPPGVTRGIDQASGVGLLFLDIDNAREELTGEFWPDPRTGEPTKRPKVRKVCIDSPVALEEVGEHLQRVGIASMGWTTYSHTAEHEKHRWVIPLAYPVPVHLWPRAAEWALEHLGINQFRRGLDVPVVHNAAALAFLPGSPDPSTIRRAESFGAHLAIPLEGLPIVPPRPLEHWQAEVVAERQAERERGEQWWQAYRINGYPVEFKDVDLAAILEARGIKTKPSRAFKTGTKHRAWCPWGVEHSKGRDDDDAVVIHTPGKWPTFKCLHSGHLHLGLRDVIEWAWGKP